MKLFPSAKLFGISYLSAFIINISEMFRVDGLTKLIAWLLIDNLILAIIIVVILRVMMWVGTKLGMSK